MSETDPRGPVEDGKTATDEPVRDVAVIGGGAAGVSAGRLFAGSPLLVTVRRAHP